MGAACSKKTTTRKTEGSDVPDTQQSGEADPNLPSNRDDEVSRNKSPRQPDSDYENLSVSGDRVTNKSSRTDLSLLKKKKSQDPLGSEGNQQTKDIPIEQLIMENHMQRSTIKDKKSTVCKDDYSSLLPTEKPIVAKKQPIKAKPKITAEPKKPEPKTARDAKTGTGRVGKGRVVIHGGDGETHVKSLPIDPIDCRLAAQKSASHQETEVWKFENGKKKAKWKKTKHRKGSSSPHVNTRETYSRETTTMQMQTHTKTNDMTSSPTLGTFKEQSHLKTTKTADRLGIAPNKDADSRIKESLNLRTGTQASQSTVLVTESTVNV